MPLYTIAVDQAWVPNAYGRQEQRVLGEDVTLTEDQAEYLILAGQIIPAEAYVPVVPQPFRASDVLILQRGGSAQKIEPEDIAAYVSPLITDGEVEPEGLSPLVASFL